MIGNPPKYRYSLYKQWDRDTFNQLKGIGKSKKFPRIIGSFNDKNQLLITLIRTQKSLNDWRNFLKDILKQVKENNIIDTFLLKKKYPPDSIGKNIPDWVTYKEDKIVNNFIDDLGSRKVKFVGTDEEIVEFIMRFILGQLGHDWEQTIMMIWEMLGDENKLSLKDLNKEMKNFDYLNLFE